MIANSVNFMGLVADPATSPRLELDASPGFLWFAGVVMLIAICLSVRAWLRSYRRGSIALLELLRLTLIAAVLFVLMQPEWVVTEEPERAPVVAVLWDDSMSMNTRDVPASEADGGEVEGGMRSRASVVADWVSDMQAAATARGESSGDETRVVFTPISDALTASDAGPDDSESDEPDPSGESEESGPVGALGTDLATPLDELLGGDTLRAVVLLSDGDWNEGRSPYESAREYRLAGVPIFTRTVGSATRLPDITLEPVDPPAFAIVNRPIDLPISIDSAMPRDVTTTVTLRDENGIVEGPRTILVPAQRKTPEKLVYRPTAPGRVTLTVEVAPVAGELDDSDNVRTFEIDVREERLRVLLVESYPRWEYRYLRNALVRDPGVDVDCYLTHPSVEGVGGGPQYLDAFPPKELLSAYDVVFIGDVGLGAEGLTAEQCDQIAGLVRDQASGLILMPGLGGGQMDLQETELGDLFPVDLDPGMLEGTGSSVASPLVLTELGESSSLTRLIPGRAANSSLWLDLPGFQWNAPVMRARVGSQVLAVHGGASNERGRIPLLVTRTARTGKVLFMGTDGAWRWREGYEDRYHYRFWGQVIRWMAYQRNMNVGESMRLFFTPDRPRARSTIALNANVMDATGAPLGGATVTARIEAPSGRVERISFEPVSGTSNRGDDSNLDQGAWGLYSATFRPREPGRHRATLTCEETGAVLEAEIPVVGDPLEQVGRPARLDTMEELARLTRGNVMRAITLEALDAELREIPPPPPIVGRERVWAHPLLGGAIALLMTLFWIGRKLVGRV